MSATTADRCNTVSGFVVGYFRFSEGRAVGRRFRSVATQWSRLLHGRKYDVVVSRRRPSCDIRSNVDDAACCSARTTVTARRCRDDELRRLRSTQLSLQRSNLVDSTPTVGHTVIATSRGLDPPNAPRKNSSTSLCFWYITTTSYVCQIGCS